MIDLETRRNTLYDWMAAEGIALVMLEDREGARDPAIRYLSGHPGDALLFLSATRKALLICWDVPLAKQLADVDQILPLADFGRDPALAANFAAVHFKIHHGSRIEIPAVTSYPAFLRFVDALRDWDVLCREDGASERIAHLRARKDLMEMDTLREGARITNELIDLIEEAVRAGSLATELEIALFIEEEARKRGCEGTGFETLAAGPARSFAIHAFPAYTAGAFGTTGLSILDFGLKYRGYTTDVTLTFARGPLSRTQERMLTLVQTAYDMALTMATVGTTTQTIAVVVDALFAKAKRAMPHALGHGIGLEAHEAPTLRSRGKEPWTLEPGMVITLEPGLYDPKHGGCRLENDVQVTPEGPEVLTKARIIRLD